MFKVVSTMTVKDIKRFIGANSKLVKEADPKLYDIIVKADKALKNNPKSVRKGDLLAIAKDIAILLKDTVIDPFAKPVPAVENSLKPRVKGGTNKPVDTKKDEKQSPAPKEEPKKSSIFPDTLEVDDVKYELEHDVKSMKDLLDGFLNDEEYVFAFYWTKRHLTKYQYAGGTLEAPESFEDDLDLASVMYVSEACKVVYALSMTTESLYQVMPEAFKETNGIRYSMGIEYQIYHAVSASGKTE